VPLRACLPQAGKKTNSIESYFKQLEQFFYAIDLSFTDLIKASKV